MDEKKDEPKPCAFCGKPCHPEKELVGYRLLTGEAWHARCNPPT